jgi:hypothetical protein
MESMENMEKIPPLTPYRVGQFDRDADYGVRDVTQHVDREQ